MQTKIAVLIFLFSCSSSLKNRNTNNLKTNVIEIEIQEIGNIRKGSKNIIVNLLIKNSQSIPVYINDPTCWGSSIPLIRFNRAKAYSIIKIKINPECAKKLVRINGNDSIVLTYKYYLDEFIDVNRIGNYNLQFAYSGALYSVSKDKLKNIDLLTNAISFDISN